MKLPYDMEISANTVVAVDFDGTLCRSAFPDCGEPIIEVVNVVKEIKKKGATIILWTCREEEALSIALDWCKEHGLEFDYINENDPKRTELWGSDCRKVGADLYLDDRAINVLSLIGG